MKKNKNDIIDSAINKRVIVEEFCFKMGDWKNLFQINDFKLVIAGALNLLQKDNLDFIVGYLINPDEVYLITHQIKPIQKNTINLFKDALHNEIVRFSSYLSSKKAGENADGKSLQNATINMEQLFTCYPINNSNLLKILTGQKIVQNYYDPGLAKLKEEIRHNHFCSAIDYSGAVGPVAIKLNRP